MDKILSGRNNTKWQLGREAPNRGVSNDYPIGRKNCNRSRAQITNGVE